MKTNPSVSTRVAPAFAAAINLGSLDGTDGFADLLIGSNLDGSAGGAISVKAKTAGPGGNLTGASLVASKTAALTVAKNFTSSIVLAGADLGAAHAIGGGDDTFAAGLFKAAPKIGGVAVDPTTAPRFNVA